MTMALEITFLEDYRPPDIERMHYQKGVFKTG